MVRFMLMSACVFAVTNAAVCPDDPEVDLCDGTEAKEDFATRQMSAPTMALALAVANALGGSGLGSLAGPMLMGAMLVPGAAAGGGASTCGHVKAAYKANECCGAESKKELSTHMLVPKPTKKLSMGENPCAGKKPSDTYKGGAFKNYECVNKALEQSGADVSATVADRATPMIDAVNNTPIARAYWKGANNGGPNTGPLCPVNVHWHLGAEHRSKGEYDESGKSPEVGGETPATAAPTRRLRNGVAVSEEEYWGENRRLAGTVRYGFACNKYDSTKTEWTTEYDWQHCEGMKVGATYEVHWPHSILGKCNTPWQMQSPFYDGVFCNYDEASHFDCVANGNCLSNAVGVQGQVFTIINDESYFYPNLINGMIVTGDFGKDIAYYTGSSTGTTRDNEICSPYAPITWQVDRKCHVISASSFDKLCADMKNQYDDMSSDLHAHGARVLVAGKWTANNQATADHSR